MRHLSLLLAALLLTAPAFAQEDGDEPAPASGDTSISGGGQGLGGQGVQSGSGDRSGSGGGGRAMSNPPAGGGPSPAPSSFQVVDLDKLPNAQAGGHKRINLKGMKGLAVRFHTHDYSGRMFQFITATFLGGQASDVTFKAAVSKTPGDLSPAPPCAIKGVTQDGAGQTRARSEIMVVVDPHEAGAGATPRERQMAGTSNGYVQKGLACPLAAQTVYYYNIVGDCDYASIEHQNSMGWDNKGPQNGCPIALVNNSVMALAPGFNLAAEQARAAAVPKGATYASLTPAEEARFQAWLASLPPNIRTVYQAAGDGARYKWWQENVAGK